MKMSELPRQVILGDYASDSYKWNYFCDRNSQRHFDLEIAKRLNYIESALFKPRCKISVFSSSICQFGIKGCTTLHEKNE